VRATEDLDLFIRATAENVERLRFALKEAYGPDPHIDEITATDLLGDYRAVRYYPPTGDLYLGVMTRLGDAANFDTVESETKHIGETHVTVATPAALYRSRMTRFAPRIGRMPTRCANAFVGPTTDLPVEKFRSGEAMNDTPARRRESDFDRFLRPCARYWAAAPKTYPRGVFRFRSVDEMRHPPDAPQTD
jgi:hypothetical protein